VNGYWDLILITNIQKIKFYWNNTMEKIYFDELNRITNSLNKYYEESHQNINKDEDYTKNLNIKNNIKDLIIKAKTDISLREDEKQIIINDSLKLLAENTGCVEDCMISENILNELRNKDIIKQNDIDYYNSNENTGRWK
jgi:hypothetical protein